MKTMKKRKGFTLTELAIVIAVIAILIAVLVPTFTSLINKAHESTDSQLAKNMNTLLSTAELDGTPERMEDVNYLLEEGGYKLENLNPTAEGNIFVWNSASNRISYIDSDGTVLYAGDSTLTADSAFEGGNNYWLTAKNESQMTTWKTYKLSYYIATSSFESSTLTFSYAAGVDTGTYTVGAIEYTDSGENVSVSPITSSSKTKVGGNNAKAATEGEVSTDTAIIRGTVKNLTVSNTNISVINYASVTSETKITEAAEYTESGYSVSLVVNSNSAKVTIANNGYVAKISAGTGITEVNVTNNGSIVSSSIDSVAVSTSTSYNISTYTELASFRDKVNNGATFKDVTVTLTANIDISGRAWTPIGYDSRENPEKYYNDDDYDTMYYCFQGIFDGKGNTISGLTNTGFMPTVTRQDTYGKGSSEQTNYLYGLFGIVDGATIKDLKLTNVDIVVESTRLDGVGAIAGLGMGSLTIDSCVVSGSVIGTDAVAGIVGRVYNFDNDDVVNITNCVNNATVSINATGITDNSGKAAGIVGFYKRKTAESSYNSSSDKLSITIDGCVNNGKITGYTYGAGIIIAEPAGTGSTNDKLAYLTVKNCTNNNVITGQDKTSCSLGSIACWSSSKEVSWNVENSCKNNGSLVYGTEYTDSTVWNFSEDTYTKIVYIKGGKDQLSSSAS